MLKSFIYLDKMVCQIEPNPFTKLTKKKIVNRTKKKKI